MKKMNYEIDDTKISKWNTAQLTGRRIDLAWLEIYYLEQNPIVFNAETGLFNYERLMNNYLTIFFEVCSKANKKDLENIWSFRLKLEELMKKYPIHKPSSKLAKYRWKFNMINWEIIKEALNKYKLLLKLQEDKTGWGSPSKDDPRRAITQR